MNVKMVALDEIKALIDSVKENVVALDKKISILGKDELFPTPVEKGEQLSTVKSQGNERVLVLREELARFSQGITDSIKSSLESASAGSDCPGTQGGHEKPVTELMEQMNIWVTNVSSVFSDRVSNGLLAFEEGLCKNVLDSDTPEGKRFSCFSQEPGIKSAMESLKSAITNVTNSTTCEKDGLIIPLQSYFPYLVVSPNQDDSTTSLQVPQLCETHTLGGGWIVIQRRSTGNVDFNRKWQDYKQGFGSFSDDFWFGLEHVHQLTSRGVYELRVDLKRGETSAYAHYATFSIASELEKYALLVGSYSGTAGDQLAYHSGRPFSTHDKDNDSHSTNCAVVHHIGGWWYGGCAHSALNGGWQVDGAKGVWWRSLFSDKSATFSEMKIRHVN